MNFKKLSSFALASLMSLNAFAVSPSVSFAKEIAVEKSVSSKEAGASKSKINEDELKAKIKLLEEKLMQMEKDANKKQKASIDNNSDARDKELKGKLNVLRNLPKILSKGIVAGVIGFALCSGLGVNAIITSIVTGASIVGASTLAAWISYFEGSIAQYIHIL